MRTAFIALLLAAAAQTAVSRDVNDLAWLTGCWETADGDRWTEECWSRPRAGLMLGSSRSGRGETLGEWESLRIAREGEGLAYHASPGGKGWTVFKAEPFPGPGIAFFNRAHDYPQRIRYWREGRTLVAEIARADGQKARRWHYRSAGAAISR